jgi:hypothetical protein
VRLQLHVIHLDRGEGGGGEERGQGGERGMEGGEGVRVLMCCIFDVLLF